MWDEIVGSAKEQAWQEIGRRIPAGRMAKPEDIALAYLFILSSALMTGEVVHIDGGQSLI